MGSTSRQTRPSYHPYPPHPAQSVRALPSPPASSYCRWLLPDPCPCSPQATGTRHPESFLLLKYKLDLVSLPTPNLQQMIFGDTLNKAFISLPDIHAPSLHPPASLNYPTPLPAPRETLNSQLWSLMGTTPAVPSLWNSQPS